MKKAIMKAIKIDKIKYLSLSKKNQKISNENTSYSYNKKLIKIF